MLIIYTFSSQRKRFVSDCTITHIVSLLLSRNSQGFNVAAPIKLVPLMALLSHVRVTHVTTIISVTPFTPFLSYRPIIPVTQFTPLLPIALSSLSPCLPLLSPSLLSHTPDTSDRRVEVQHCAPLPPGQPPVGEWHPINQAL